MSQQHAGEANRAVEREIEANNQIISDVIGNAGNFQQIPFILKSQNSTVPSLDESFKPFMRKIKNELLKEKQGVDGIESLLASKETWKAKLAKELLADRYMPTFYSGMGYEGALSSVVEGLLRDGIIDRGLLKDGIKVLKSRKGPDALDLRSRFTREQAINTLTLVQAVAENIVSNVERASRSKAA